MKFAVITYDLPVEGKPNDFWCHFIYHGNGTTPYTIDDTVCGFINELMGIESNMPSEFVTPWNKKASEDKELVSVHVSVGYFDDKEISDDFESVYKYCKKLFLDLNSQNSHRQYVNMRVEDLGKTERIYYFSAKAIEKIRERCYNVYRKYNNEPM